MWRQLSLVIHLLSSFDLYWKIQDIPFHGITSTNFHEFAENSLQIIFSKEYFMDPHIKFVSLFIISQFKMHLWWRFLCK